MTSSISESGTTPALERALTAVASDHRRAVLRTLDHSDDEVMTFEALVDQVADRVRDDGSGGDDGRRRVRTALHHVHLPKLEASGMIVHDTETGQVRNVTDELGQELLAVLAPYETVE